MKSSTTHDQQTVAADAEEAVRQVRERYGAIARSGGSCCGPQTSCCGSSPERAIALSLGYTPIELELLPDGANLGLGCGAPLAHLAPQPGETVLDLGSGAGVDVILAARAVGPAGRAIGVDMTDEMLERARRNVAAAGLDNVELRHGRLESLPVADASVDAVTSNCVVNLVPDKAAVFLEIARVLRPGGRLVISDVLLDAPLPDAIRQDVLAYVGCVSGAAERGAYFAMLDAAGLTGIEVLHDVDFLASVGGEPPEEISEAIGRAGLDASDLVGVIRSVTYRARKPQSP